MYQIGLDLKEAGTSRRLDDSKTGDRGRPFSAFEGCRVSYCPYPNCGLVRHTLDESERTSPDHLKLNGVWPSVGTWRNTSVSNKCPWRIRFSSIMKSKDNVIRTATGGILLISRCPSVTEQFERLGWLARGG